MSIALKQFVHPAKLYNSAAAALALPPQSPWLMHRGHEEVLVVLLISSASLALRRKVYTMKNVFEGFERAQWCEFVDVCKKSFMAPFLIAKCMKK
ncbi:hypothetical protein COP2_021920 [Malus domestica]